MKISCIPENSDGLRRGGVWIYCAGDARGRLPLRVSDLDARVERQRAGGGVLGRGRTRAEACDRWRGRVGGCRRSTRPRGRSSEG